MGTEAELPGTGNRPNAESAPKRFRLALQLPWPPSALSPNGQHGHWTRRAEAKKNFRCACWIATIEQLSPRMRASCVAVVPLQLLLEFVRPDRRSYDRDNLLARTKAGIDGMCQALGIDDGRFVSITVSVADEVVAGGLVRVVLVWP